MTSASNLTDLRSGAGVVVEVVVVVAVVRVVLVVSSGVVVLGDVV